MARFRLRSAHQLRHNEYKTDVWLPGDKENEHLGDERGTLVGDGTPYPVAAATLEMIPLDEDAERMLRKEEERLAGQTMNPIDSLPLVVVRDDYENRFVPGFPGVQRPSATSK